MSSATPRVRGAAATSAASTRDGAAARRLGLVALGDSITVGEGSMTLGVTPLSWAQWLARSLDLPFTSYAFNGATTADVLREQLPRVRADHDLAAIYAGVNEVRDPGFDLTAYERDLDAVAAGLAARVTRLLMVTLPHDLGRPTSAPKPPHASSVVRRIAGRHRATVVDLSDFGGWTLVLPDTVHPTAVGQFEIADRAARALGAKVLPSALAGERTGSDARYAPAHARANVKLKSGARARGDWRITATPRALLLVMARSPTRRAARRSAPQPLPRHPNGPLSPR